MKPDDFYVSIENFFAKCMGVMKSKGKAYSGQGNVFSNFERAAAKRNIPVTSVWSIFFDKHLDALNSYLNGEYEDNEPIEGRILDLINYLFLLYGIITEGKRS